MSDVLTPEQRHKCMSKVKNKNTLPEIMVRKFLFSKGFRYRIADKKLPGKPDIVLPKYRAVIFVNGCFWHGHESCKYAQRPASNAEFWESKISDNIERDKRTRFDLEKLGWRVIVIWQCQLKPKAIEATLNQLINELTTDCNGKIE